jgi:Protein of unknown function (DUF4058)
MRPQFPGMDPWLEQATLWPDVHSSLITSIRDTLAPVLAPRYFVGVQTRTTVLSGLDIEQIYKPDVTIYSAGQRGESKASSVALLEPSAVAPIDVVIPGGEEVEETYLAIQELPGRKLVSVIEVLSPTNKKTADGRREYLKKRDDWIDSRVNLVEIDLLRGGEPMPIKDPPPQTDYHIVICRAGRRRSAKLYAFSCRSPIPAITIPLVPGDPEPALDLNAVLHSLIERAHYDLVIDYRQPPQPPLRSEDDSWAAAIIAGASVRDPNPMAGNGA